MAAYVSNVLFIHTGERLARKIREQYLAAILRQNIGFFDILGAGEFTTRITSDMNLVQDGISEKVGFTMTGVVTFTAGFVVGFIKSWKLTLVLSSSLAAIILLLLIAGPAITKSSKAALATYAVGGSIAEEVISSISNIQAFGVQQKMANDYESHLTEASKWGFKEKRAFAIVLSLIIFIIYLNYGLCFWQGSRMADRQEADLAAVITVLESLILGGFALANVAPFLKAFTTATAAGAKVFSVIDRVSPIDVTLEQGQTLENFRGEIAFRGVKHIYPSRPNATVLEDFSLLIPAGKVTALVGSSGSGKSSVIELIERFYDPVGGQIFFDGHDARSLKLKSLRENMALVTQEPVLFSTTIFDNIAFGLFGTSYENCAFEKKSELVVNAARVAQADGFIRDFPDGYDTMIGERGMLLSGGQKQRLAIARAIVSDPKVLLLDEATSSLDSSSERIVQVALDDASKHRTTLVIAHRLSTIRNANNIVVMHDGKIVEQGSHDELLERKFAYYDFVQAQNISMKDLDAEDVGKANLEPAHGLRSRIVDAGESNATEGMEAFPSRQVLETPTKVEPEKQSSPVTSKQHTNSEFSVWSSIKWITSFSMPEAHWMLFGVIFSVLGGLGMTAGAFIVAKATESFALAPSPTERKGQSVAFWSVMFLVLAFAELLCYASLGIAFAYCSEKLIYRVRDKSFRSIVRQNIGFFSMKENATGALTSLLSNESTRLAGTEWHDFGNASRGNLNPSQRACTWNSHWLETRSGVCRHGTHSFGMRVLPILAPCRF